VGSRLPRHASLAGRAVDQRRSLTVDNVASGGEVVLPRILVGSPVGAVAVAPILTEDHQLGAIEARDDFLAAASHDLKNPLTVIRGSILMLERTRARTGEIPRERLDLSIRTISSSAARMTALIEELLDVARLRMGNPLVLEKAPSDLVALARQLMAIHQSATEKHTIVLDARVPELVGLGRASPPTRARQPVIERQQI